MMEKPDVAGAARIQPMVDLKIVEEVLPLLAKPMCDIIP
jgi:hypothetical protein